MSFLGYAPITHIHPTHRLAPILALAITLIVIPSIHGGPITIGIALFLLIATCRGIASLQALALSRCEYRIEAEGRSEDDHVKVRIIIENRSYVPILLAEVSLKHSPHLKLVEGFKAALIPIPPKGSTVLELSFEPRIGKHSIGPIDIVVRDPLGLFRSSPITINIVKEVHIAPRVSEVYIRKLLARTRSSGVTRSKEPGTGVEFYSVREFRPGDDLRCIDWKHYAATMRLVVKEMERESFQSVLFVVDATPNTLYGPRKNTPLEHVLRIVASVSLYLSRRGDLQGVVVYSFKGVMATGLRRGKKAFEEILRVLSSIELDLSPMADSERAKVLTQAIKKVISLLPRERNAIFILTTSGGKNYLETLSAEVSRLISLGNEVYVILPLAILYQAEDLPKWAKLAFRVKTYEILKKEMEFAGDLRRRGAKVITAIPQYIPRTIVEIIERMPT